MQTEGEREGEVAVCPNPIAAVKNRRYASCSMNQTWADMRRIDPNTKRRYAQGGLGKLMTEEQYEVWLCDGADRCADSACDQSAVQECLASIPFDQTSTEDVCSSYAQLYRCVPAGCCGMFREATALLNSDLGCNVACEEDPDMMCYAYNEGSQEFEPLDLNSNLHLVTSTSHAMQGLRAFRGSSVGHSRLNTLRTKHGLTAAKTKTTITLEELKDAERAAASRKDYAVAKDLQAQHKKLTELEEGEQAAAAVGDYDTAETLQTQYNKLVQDLSSNAIMVRGRAGDAVFTARDYAMLYFDLLPDNLKMERHSWKVNQKRATDDSMVQQSHFGPPFLKIWPHEELHRRFGVGWEGNSDLHGSSKNIALSKSSDIAISKSWMKVTEEMLFGADGEDARGGVPNANKPPSTSLKKRASAEEILAGEANSFLPA